MATDQEMTDQNLILFFGMIFCLALAAVAGVRPLHFSWLANAHLMLVPVTLALWWGCLHYSTWKYPAQFTIQEQQAYIRQDVLTQVAWTSYVLMNIVATLLAIYAMIDVWIINGPIYQTLSDLTNQTSLPLLTGLRFGLGPIFVAQLWSTWGILRVARWSQKAALVNIIINTLSFNVVGVAYTSFIFFGYKPIIREATAFYPSMPTT